MFIAGIFISMAGIACANFIQIPQRHITGKHLEFKWNNLFEETSIVPSINLFIMMIPYGGILSFIALYGRELGIQNSSYFFLIFSFGVAAARLTTGKEFDKNGPRRILTFCFALLLLGFPLLASAKNSLLFYLSAVIIGFGNGVTFPTFQSMVNNLTDNTHRGAANSTLYTSVDLGMGLGMIASGFVAQYASISTVFWMCAIISVAGLAFLRICTLKFYQSRVLS